jgi:NADPH:quinone reductase-like Zn-dependent oxidoreductase
MKVFEIREQFGIDSLKLTERPQPEPGPEEVLVQVRAASLNYRDLLVITGQYNPRMPLPRIPLSDAAGEVVAVGSHVSRVKVGDRVTPIFTQTWLEGELDHSRSQSALGGAIDGVLTELIVVHQEGVVPVPDHLSFAEAATLPCAGVTAWNAVMHSGIRPGQSVLLLGTGGVSLFGLQFAKLAGAQTIITSSSDEKLARAEGLGATETINYRSQPAWDRPVRELTAQRGVDLVVEVGGAGTLPLSLKAVRVAGTVALIGVLTGTGGEFNPLPAVMKHVTLRGIYVGSRKMFEEMNRAIELHQLRPVIDRTFPFEEAPAALRYMQTAAHFGKIVIEF